MEDNVPETDASSIKPVSSLLARFEQLNKTSPEPKSTPSSATPSAVQSRSQSQTRSQSPKRQASQSGFVSPAPSLRRERPASPTKARPNGAAGLLQYTPPEVPRTRPMSMMSPTGTCSPFVTVHPPSSPTKPPLHINTTPNPLDFLAGERGTQSAHPGRAFKIPSRPTTPLNEPAKSPLLGPTTYSLPPDPPPPRRSGEFRRPEPPAPPKPLSRAPPPINRAEKPKIPAKPQIQQATPAGFGRQIVQENFTPNPLSSGLTRSISVRDGSPLRDLPAGRPAIPVRPGTNEFGKSLNRAHTMGPRGASPFNGTTTPRKVSNGLGRPAPPPPFERNAPPSLPARPPTYPPPPRQSSDPNRLQEQPMSVSGPRATKSYFPQDQHVSVEVATSIPTARRNVSTPLSGPGLQVASPSPSRAPSAVDLANARAPPPPAERKAQPRIFSGTQETPMASIITTIQPTASSETPQYPDLPDDGSRNRRPPFAPRCHETKTTPTTKIYDVMGNYVCTSGTSTRAWDLSSGQQLLEMPHGEGPKMLTVAYKWAAHPEEEGKKIWLGNSIGDILEVDIKAGYVTRTISAAHSRHEVMKIYRHKDGMWSLDDVGTLHVWTPDAEGNLTSDLPTETHRVPKGHATSVIAGDELWYASGRDIRVFNPSSANGQPFQVLQRALFESSVGEILTSAVIKSQPDKVYFGHTEGKVTVWDRKSFSCVGVYSMNAFKANALLGVGDYLWAGYSSGHIEVYDTTQTPWIMKKEWKAHDGPITGIVMDKSYAWKQDQLLVVSLGTDSKLKAWDGLLREDFLENDLQSRDAEYCTFTDIKTLVFTWNCGASTPHSLRYQEQDSTFMRNLLTSSNSPDILVFGFQELVDLEDKKATAKSFFKSKKKDPSTDQERMSHQYRDWRDYLIRSLDDNMPKDDLYHLLQSSTLVGLFTCIFVKSHLRDRIKNLSATEVKRGMGGYHGNKGALVIRFTLDDSSMCFVNCHLAAGQTAAKQRHADIAAILAGDIFPSERDPTTRLNSLIGGGDGSMILDHELCIWNGDLNYRIDTMSRDAVVNAVRSGNLEKLLERDQLLVSRRKKQDFPLRMYTEMPITFAPTYKYDVGTDTYDTSEKKRAPAWCDRVLYRDGSGRGRIRQTDYRRHEVRVSDHRPVSALFEMTIKAVDPARRQQVWESSGRRFERARREMLGEGMV